MKLGKTAQRGSPHQRALGARNWPMLPEPENSTGPGKTTQQERLRTCRTKCRPQCPEMARLHTQEEC